MGTAQTRKNVLPEIERLRPATVLTCGYAGGLRASLATGDVVFDHAEMDSAGSHLERLRAIRARFIQVDRVLASATEKAALRVATGGDAIDMESKGIRDHCANLGIRSLTIRVISDQSGEDMPLNFGKMTRPDQTLDPWKLAKAIARQPGKIPELLRFQSRLKLCGSRLADTIAGLIQAEMESAPHQA